MVDPNIVDQIETARKDLRFRIYDRKNWRSVSERQKSSAVDPQAKGPTWVSRVSLPPPEEDDVRQALFQTIDRLCTGSETYSKPAIAPVEGEWVGQRLNIDAQAPEPHITEEEKYHGLMRDASSDVTMLYVHGGLFWCGLFFFFPFAQNADRYYTVFKLRKISDSFTSSGSPGASRPMIAKLTRLTRGQCFSLRYRLSPQHPFPAALLDLLLAYLSLLYPQPGPSTYHLAVSAPRLVLTGDSAGANLCLGLIQTILSLGRQQSRYPPLVRWNGADRPIHLPAGVALISPWIDSLYTLPSHTTNQRTDYLPPFNIRLDPDFPQCSAWPTELPREDIYCNGSCLMHPLVNPAAVDNWGGTPPMLVLCGEEGPSDAVKILVRQLYEQGITMRWRQFERLPHVFMSLMEKLEHSRVALAEWAGFCEEVVEARDGIKSNGQFIHVRDLTREVVSLEDLTEMTREQALMMLNRASGKRRAIERKYESKAKI